MDAAGGDRLPCRGGAGPISLSIATHHAADAAGIAVLRPAIAVLAARPKPKHHPAGSKKPAPEHALAKSQWSFKTATELSAALAARKSPPWSWPQDAIGRNRASRRHDQRGCVRDFDRGLDARPRRRRRSGRGETGALLGIPDDCEGHSTTSRDCPRPGASSAKI